MRFYKDKMNEYNIIIIRYVRFFLIVYVINILVTANIQP